MVTIATRCAVDGHGITKDFRRSEGSLFWRNRSRMKRVLDQVDLRVADGEMVAIVGLNGSGKSTLIRILATLTMPDSGTVHIFGYDVVSQSSDVRRFINRVSVEASFFKEMSPWENLLYATRLYGQTSEGARTSTVETLDRLGLPRDAIDRPMKHLSRGQQQKVAIARSFLTSPSLLLMDEPTTGLDPRSKREVQSFVADIRRERGATVVISTHDLNEAEACDRVVFLEGGRVLADDTPSNLVTRYGGPDATSSLEDVFLSLTGKSLEDDTEDEPVNCNGESS